MKFRERQQRLVSSRTTSEDDDRVILMASVQHRRSLRLDALRRRSYESQLPSVTDDETTCVHSNPVDVASALAQRRGRSASVFDSVSRLPASLGVMTCRDLFHHPSRLASANDTAAHYAAIHCSR